MKYNVLASGLLGMALTFLPGAVHAQVGPDDVESFEDYVVKDGDTCTSIARQFYGDVYAYDIIHAFNDLSATAYACTPGTALKLPKLKPRPEAAVQQAFGAVKSAGPETQWQDAERGMPLFRAWKVNTLEESRAELAFRDQSELAMSENTLVVIYGPRKADALARSVPRAQVEKGKLKARLTQLSGGIDVETPSAQAEMEAGVKQVSVDDDGTTRVENQSGSPIRVSGKGKSQGRKVQVKAGFGTRVVQDKAPERPRALPQTPKWTDESQTYGLTLGDTPASISATWEPIKDAERYYVELSRDMKGADVFFSGFVAADVRRLEVKELPPGTYYAAVSSVDSELFESVPSKPKVFQVESVKVSENGMVSGASNTLWLGASLSAPPGKKCGVEAMGPRFEIKQVGDLTVKCEGQGRSASLALKSEPPKPVELPESVQAERGEVLGLSLRFEPIRTKGLRVEAPEGVIVNAFGSEAPDELLVQIVPNAEAVDGELRLMAYDTPIATIPLKVVEPEASDADSSGPPVWTSALAGWSDDGLNLDLRVGVLTTPWFAGELRLAPGSLNEDQGFFFEGGFQFLLGLLDSRVAPHLAAGVHARAATNEDISPLLRGGIGVAFKPGESLRLRLETGVSILPDEDFRLPFFLAGGVSFEW